MLGIVIVNKLIYGEIQESLTHHVLSFWEISRNDTWNVRMMFEVDRTAEVVVEIY